MKILHVGMAVMPAISRELSKLGPYRFFDWTQYMELGPGAKEVLKRDLLKVSEQMNPDITFLHIQRAGVIDASIASLLKGFVINYTYDVALPIPSWYEEVGRKINLTLFCDVPGVQDFLEKGIEAEFMQVGYDQMVFRPNGSTGDFLNDIVFLGNNYDDSQGFHLTNQRSEMVKFLKDTYGHTFKVYGNKWPYQDGNLMYRESKEAECYRSAKIGISISHFDLERYTSDRTFRIMGCGTFCLIKWYPGIEKDFTDGVHLRVWKTFDELKELIDYYIEHEEERKTIARNGYNLVIETATWEHRMKTINEMANAKMSKQYKSRVVKVAQQFHKKPEEIAPILPTPHTQIIPTPSIKAEIIIPALPKDMPASPHSTSYPQTIIEDTDHSNNLNNLVPAVHGVQFLDEIPILKIDSSPSDPEHLKLYSQRRIDYNRLKDTCFFKLNKTEAVDVSVIIPVRSRSNFNEPLVKHLKQAMAFFPGKTYSITFVEYSVNMEHEQYCTGDVNYINVPFGGYFNKCLAFNVGALFSNKAKYFLFHDLDIIMKKDFFKNIFANLEKNPTALQPFRLRRVLYCSEALSKNVISGGISIDALHTKYHGITEPNLPEQMRAPGGSIFVSKEQFVEAGGYDPELFFGYSIEDQFFYDKLNLTGGIRSCNDPGIEVFHLWHPPLWSSNPFLTHHQQIYETYSKLDIESKKKFMLLEKQNIQNFI